MSKCLIGNISKEIIEELGVSYSYLSDNDFEICLKDLVLEDYHEEERLTLFTSFVYMFDYEDSEMSQITMKLKEKGVQAIYAASTTHNLQWTLKELLNELTQEHQTFQAMDQLKKMIKEMIHMPVDENKEEVEKALMAAFIALQKRDLSIMNQMIQELKKYQKKSD